MAYIFKLITWIPFTNYKTQNPILLYKTLHFKINLKFIPPQNLHSHSQML